MKRSKELKNRWTDVIMRIQHKSGEIIFDSDYKKVIDIFWGKPLPINDVDYEFIESVIKKRENYFREL